MKKILTTVIIAIAICSSVFPQDQYEVSRDAKNGSKVLKGIISRDLLLNDTSFKWWTENQKNYTLNANAISAMQKNRDTLQLLVFMGTWCDDSQFIIPKLYSLIDASGFPESRITLIGVDRSKKTLSHLAEALDITNVPTIIVLKGGKELGRVVEYGKSGLFDKDLGEIINSASN